MTWSQVSASQIALYRACPRKWYNSAILKDREPQKPAQILGEEIHAEVEHYLRTSKSRPSKHQRLVDVMAGNLPDPGPRKFLLIEHQLGAPPGTPSPEKRGTFTHWLPTFDGGPRLVGLIDYVDLEYPPEVGDVKTKSDLRYCLTPEELLVDVQMMTYANWILDLTGLDMATIAHVYGTTTGKPQSIKRDVNVKRDHVKRQWDGILATVREMKAWADRRPESADALPPTSNVGECEKYKGCYYRAKCGFFVGFGRTNGGETTMTLKERILANQKAKAAAAQEAPPAPPIAGSAAPSPVTPTPPVEQVAGPLGVLPPDAPSRTPVQPKAEEAAEAPKKRGRPKKQVSVTIEGVEVETPHIETPPAEEVETFKAKISTKAERNAIPLSNQRPVLLIDCFPRKGSFGCGVVELAEWIEPIAETVAKEMNVPDWQLIDYGRAKGALATGIRAEVELRGFPPVVTVSSFSRFSDVFLEVALPYASLVIQGVRL